MSIRRPKQDSRDESISLVALALLAQSLLGGAVTIWLSFQVWGPSTARVTHPRAWLLFAFFSVLVAPVLLAVLIRLVRPAGSAVRSSRPARRSGASERVLVNASHELRTPLTAILGAAETLAEQDVTSADRKAEAATIRRQGEHLLAILENIVDLAAIESKKMKLATCPFEVASVIFDVVGELRPSAEEKGLSLDVMVPTPIPEMISSDPARFRQVVDNLVRNAIAFTKKGGVRVLVTNRESKRDGTRLVIEVLDTGIGVSDPSALFEPFRQLDASNTREVGGVGVGLSLSREMARLLGGDLWHDRTRPQGSAFIFEVPTGKLDGIRRITPVEPAPRHVASPATDERLPCHVLIAEDGVDNQVLISNHLIRAGISVTVAENGRIAVEHALAALRSGRPFDLILMDVQMPELDGYGATGELRRAGVTTPIVALTANAAVGERTRCLEAGCTDYLTKPIDRRTLLLAVARHTRHVNREKLEREEVSGVSPIASVHGSIYSDLAGDEDMVELVALFVAGLPAKMERIDHAIADGDNATVLAVAHQLKGAAGGYGFMPITFAAAALEDSVRRRATGLEERVQDLRSLCDRARVRRAA